MTSSSDRPLAPPAPVAALAAARRRRSAGPGAPVLDGLDLDVAPGEILTVVGPSGCGKSTLLRTLAGLLPPARGAVAPGRRPLTGPAADRALVFQDDALLPWRTVRANVELPLAIRGVPRAERRRAGRGAGWTGSGSPTAPASCRTSSPAGSASACSWPAPSPARRAPS